MKNHRWLDVSEDTSCCVFLKSTELGLTICVHHFCLQIHSWEWVLRAVNEKRKKKKSENAWLAQSVNHVTLGLGGMSSSPTCQGGDYLENFFS